MSTPLNQPYGDVFRKSEWLVKPCPLSDGQEMVRQYHYAKGGSNTCVYMHGLYHRESGRLCGVAWWLPPTRVACESVNKENWKKVLSLSRLVVVPGVPKNACSYLLGASVRLIRKDGRFVSLVTYADEYRGHSGHIYKVSNWTYVGKTGPYPKWIDPSSGRQVAIKATVSRSKARMLELGYANVGSFYKRKFVLHLEAS